MAEAPRRPRPTQPTPSRRPPLSMERLLAAVEHRVQAPAAFEALMEEREWRDGQRRRTLSRVWFRPPARLKSVVLESDRLPVGFTIAADGTDRVRVRLPGWLSFVTLTVPARDPRARLLNGFWPDEVSAFAFAGWLLSPGARRTWRGEERVDGAELRLVRLEGLAFPGGMTAAEVGLAANGRLGLLRLFAGGELRYECRLFGYVERCVREPEVTL